MDYGVSSVLESMQEVIKAEWKRSDPYTFDCDL